MKRVAVFFQAVFAYKGLDIFPDGARKQDVEIVKSGKAKALDLGNQNFFLKGANLVAAHININQ